MSPRSIWPSSTKERRVAFHRQGTGEGAGVPHRKTPQPGTGATFPWIVSSTAMVNHYYFYAVDDDFGPFFSSSVPIFPTTPNCASTATSGPNARRPRKASASRPLTTASQPAMTPSACNGFATGLGPAQIDRLLRKWLARLPHPFSATDRQAGYRYEISVLQAEFSLTQVLDRPTSGGCSSRRHRREPRRGTARPGVAGL